MKNIHWIRRKDLDRIIEIEKLSFPYPWQENNFIDFLSGLNMNIGVVILEEGTTDNIVGFMLYALQKNCFDLLSLAVHPDFRGKGYGTELISRAKSTLDKVERTELLTSVWERNLLAQIFFRKMGLKCVDSQPVSSPNAIGDSSYIFSYSLKDLEFQNKKRITQFS